MPIAEGSSVLGCVCVDSWLIDSTALGSQKGKGHQATYLFCPEMGAEDRHVKRQSTVVD